MSRGGDHGTLIEESERARSHAQRLRMQENPRAGSASRLQYAAGKVAVRPLARTSHYLRPRRLARPRTPPFHGDNTGSNPVGDAKFFQALTRFGLEFSGTLSGTQLLCFSERIMAMTLLCA